MKQLLLLILLSLILLVRGIRLDIVSDGRLLSGTVAEKNQFPFMAFLYVFSTQKDVKACCGSIISENFILTAAHCVYG